MKNLCWKGKAFKPLSYGKNSQKAGRNFSGSITIFHRGGGSKKLLRRIDFHRAKPARGLVERIEYDPNRTARIALVRWSNIIKSATPPLANTNIGVGASSSQWLRAKAFSYILASDKLKSGDEVLNIEVINNQSSSAQRLQQLQHRFAPQKRGAQLLRWSNEEQQLYQRSGNSLPLWMVPLGTLIHNIELYPGGGGKAARAAGTSAQLVQKLTNDLSPVGPAWTQTASLPASREASKARSGGNNSGNSGESTIGSKRQHAGVPYSKAALVMKPNHCNHYVPQCIIRLPSGQPQLIDLRCRATIGCVSNIDHGSQKLTKAGQTRWLGFRPIVRGVAMNPIDHPHGGGEGRTKGGRPSVSPWGKPAKGGVSRKKRSKI
jgi:ribosomal protein L2